MIIAKFTVISVAAFISASPIIAYAESFGARKTFIAENFSDFANRDSSLRELHATLEQENNKLVDLFERLSALIVRSVRANGCRGADIDKFSSLTKMFADKKINALAEAKKAVETRDSIGEPEFERSYRTSMLFANRLTIALGRAQLDFADAALVRHCTDLADIFYRNVFAYGPPEFSKRAELGLRDVDAQRVKSK